MSLSIDKPAAGDKTTLVAAGWKLSEDRPMLKSITMTPFPMELLVSNEGRGFTVNFPKLVHAEILSHELRALLEPVWQASHFPRRPVSIYRIRDAFVVYEGLVFDRERRLYPTTRTGHSEEEIVESVGWINAAFDANRIPIFDGPLVLCKKRGTNNYGHFLIEMFTKAVIASQSLSGTELSFLVSDESSPLSEVMRDAFQIAALGEKAIVTAGRDPVFVRDLIVVDGLSEHGSYMSPLVMDCLDTLATKLPTGNNKKIYVTRRDDARYRKVRNEREVIRELEVHGYTILSPGSMSLGEQISAFKGANTIIGVAGAAMTNICFCPKGANVICLTPASMPDTFFWFIAALRRLNYCEVRLPELGGAPPGWPTWCDDVMVDIKEILSLTYVMEAEEREREVQRGLEAKFIGTTYATSVFV